MEIYLIRHGETPPASAETYNAALRMADPPLTPRGIEQAKLLSMRLAAIPFDRILASDLRRAVDTANFLAQGRAVAVETDARFREIDMGALFLQSWDDFPELREAFLRHETDVPYPGGECGADVWRRCKNGFDEIRASGCTRAAIVCHGGTIRSILCGILNIPQERRFRLGCPPENCSISIIRYDADGASLHTFNDFAHLSN